jgi:hypothetical protein
VSRLTRFRRRRVVAPMRHPEDVMGLKSLPRTAIDLALLAGGLGLIGTAAWLSLL